MDYEAHYDREPGLFPRNERVEVIDGYKFRIVELWTKRVWHYFFGGYDEYITTEYYCNGQKISEQEKDEIIKQAREKKEAARREAEQRASEERWDLQQKLKELKSNNIEDKIKEITEAENRIKKNQEVIEQNNAERKEQEIKNDRKKTELEAAGKKLLSHKIANDQLSHQLEKEKEAIDLVKHEASDYQEEAKKYNRESAELVEQINDYKLLLKKQTDDLFSNDTNFVNVLFGTSDELTATKNFAERFFEMQQWAIDQNVREVYIFPQTLEEGVDLSGEVSK